MTRREPAPLETSAWPLFVRWQNLLGRPVSRYEFINWLTGHARLYVSRFPDCQVRARVLVDLQDEIDAATRVSVEVVPCPAR